MGHLFTIDGEAASAWLGRSDGGYALHFEGQTAVVAGEMGADGTGIVVVDGISTTVAMAIDGDRAWIHLDGAAHEVVLLDPIAFHAAEAAGEAGSVVRAPMPGAVVSVAVTPGAQVSAGDTLMIIESMKFETVIKAPRDGVVATVAFAVGQTFDRDAVLATLAEEG